MPENHLLAIPVFNEQRYVKDVLAKVRSYSRHILVVDDGSTDSTPDALSLESDIHVVTHPENRGYGQSLASAFKFAQCRGFDWLITMDCDEQHEPDYIPRFVEAALEDDADIISGTRYPQGYETDVNVPPDRRTINRLITETLNERLGLNITDAFCGFKAYRVSTLRHFNITVPGYAMPMQFWVQAKRVDLRIRELPVRLIYNDPTRHFGGLLDDPAVRHAHYLEVIESALAATPKAVSPKQQRRCMPCCG